MATNDQFDHFSRENVREDQILEAITSNSADHSGVLVGPGDDAAVLPPVAASLVVSVDQCIEHLHFLPGTPLADVGVKSVRRAAGDLAAMAASPVGLVATAFLPASMTHTEALLLYESIQQEAERLDCPLVGGDTCIQRRESDSGIHLTVTVLGSAARPVLRSSAQNQATGFLSRGAWEARLLQAATWPRRSGFPKRFNCVRALVMTYMP